MCEVIDESLIKIRDLTATVKLNNGEILTTVSNAHLELKKVTAMRLSENLVRGKQV